MLDHPYQAAAVMPERAAPPHPFAGLQPAHYCAIAVDPPLHFKARTALQVANCNSRRDTERHYSTMSFQQLAALPILSLAAPHGCHLFVWTSGPFLPQALKLIEAWGFRYSTRAFTWVKLKRSQSSTHLEFVLPLREADLHVGLGLTVRHQSEVVLLGRRGNARRNVKDVREVILAPVREHSRKPDEFFARVERYCDGPRLEVFARERRPGWDAWGNEIDKFGNGSAE
jgi:N6-adenosine-specific RNA methylase IME4